MEAHQVKLKHGHPSYIQEFCKETFNHGLSPSEIDWGDAIDVPIKHGPNYTSNGCILMEVSGGNPQAQLHLISMHAHGNRLGRQIQLHLMWMSYG